MLLLKKLQQFIAAENLFQLKDRLLVAVSGGIDSVVLCHLCQQANFNFAIAHCNFHLRGDASDADENFVEQLSKQYKVPFYLQHFDTVAEAKANKTSIEETARNLRYQWFEAIRAEHAFNYVLTAHHADDNIETVIMNFFRGTGISGLRGILPKQGKIIRPLLFARRTELEQYIKENELQFVTDHTNFENDYTRNYFRNTIIPLVNESFPETSSNVLKNIQRFKETEILYQQSVQLHLKKLLEIKGNEVHIPVLKLLKTTPLASILFEIIKPYGFTAHQTSEVIALLKSESGKYTESALYRIIKNRNWLIISPKQTTEAANILIETVECEVAFEKGIIKIQELNNDQIKLSVDNNTAMLDAATIQFPLLLRKWKQGDYFYPLGMQKKKKLSRFFIDNKLSLTQKENTWVVEMNKKIIWIAGMRIDDRFKISSNTQKVLKLTLTGPNNIA
ncbi:MAG: tRNA lysidine(34) synthetase TilS [Ferruginibacter sp.]